MKNSVVMFIFSELVFKYPYLGKLIQKIVCWSWNLDPRLIWICRFFFSFLDWKYSFWVNLVQKFKIVSLNWNLMPRLFENVNLIVMLTFSVLDLFLQLLSKKSIWYFVVAWSISQQFTRRYLKSVAFFVSIKRWRISSQKLFCQEFVPHFGFPGY